MIKNVRQHWTKKANDNLVGCKIVKVEYMPEKEVEDMMWYCSPLCILLQRPNGSQFWIFPSKDDEGNDGGALFTTLDNYPIAPVI